MGIVRQLPELFRVSALKFVLDNVSLIVLPHFLLMIRLMNSNEFQIVGSNHGLYGFGRTPWFYHSRFFFFKSSVGNRPVIDINIPVRVAVSGTLVVHGGLSMVVILTG